MASASRRSAATYFVVFVPSGALIATPVRPIPDLATRWVAQSIIVGFGPLATQSAKPSQRFVFSVIAAHRQSSPGSARTAVRSCSRVDGSRAGWPGSRRDLSHSLHQMNDDRMAMVREVADWSPSGGLTVDRRLADALLRGALSGS